MINKRKEKKWREKIQKGREEERKVEYLRINKESLKVKNDIKDG